MNMCPRCEEHLDEEVGCTDILCPMDSPCREDGDPEPLNFSLDVERGDAFEKDFYMEDMYYDEDSGLFLEDTF